MNKNILANADGFGWGLVILEVAVFAVAVVAKYGLQLSSYFVDVLAFGTLVMILVTLGYYLGALVAPIVHRCQNGR